MQRILVSVWDKTGLVDLVAGLRELFPGLDVVASGGTAQLLAEYGPVTPVETVTGFPECFGGRLKTLHPKLLGGILFRRGQDEADAEALGIRPIDAVVCNLYPFESKQAEGVTGQDLIEYIDVGGPTMLMAAVKNHASVAVLSRPSQYAEVLEELRRSGKLADATRRKLAAAACAQVAFQRAAVLHELDDAQDHRCLRLEKRMELRYGENPHQRAAYYGHPGGFEFSSEQGKLLSYNNILDLDAATDAVADLSSAAAAAVVKHGNPCGLASAATAAQALALAWDGDPISAFGSIIAVNRPVGMDELSALGFTPGGKRRFVEVLAAPDFSPEALSLLAKAKDLRLVRFQPGRDRERMTSVRGGILIQESDGGPSPRGQIRGRHPFPESLRDLADFGMLCARQLRSNAIAIVRRWPDGAFQLLGAGMGQPNRVQSVRLAAEKALENLGLPRDGRLGAEEAETCVLASDGFFPFADNLEMAARYGLKYLVEPGGSLRDTEVIEAADRLGMGILFTGRRHFRH